VKREKWAASSCAVGLVLIAQKVARGASFWTVDVVIWI
jgi:hypothetical protein